MSETKHTPGPWEIGRSAKMSSAKTGNCVATVFPKGNRGDHKTSIRITMVDEENIEETDANARLIAAAPDLLAACEAIVQVPNMKMSPQVKVVARQCLAALNKAVAQGEGR